MPSNDDSDEREFDERRRRLLQGLAATGVGLAGLGQASADDVPGLGAGTAASAERLAYAGFDHEARGGAELTLEGDALLVQDVSGGGVTANVGEAEAFVTGTGFDLDVEAGTYREFVGRGVVDGEAGQPVGSVRVTRVDGEHPLELEPVFEHVGAETYGVEVYQGGEPVYQTTGGSGPIGTQPGGDSVNLDFEVEFTGRGFEVVFKRLDLEWCFPWTDDCPIGNEIHLMPESPSAEPGPVTNVDLLGDGLAEFRIDGERVGFAGHEVEQVGNAQLHPVDGGSTLGVTGLGETGGDGVALGVNTGEGFQLSMEPTELPADGSRLASRPRGILDGTEQPLGEVGLTREDDVLVIDGDFTPIETGGVEVTLFDGDEILDELVVEAGELGFVEGDALLKNGLTWPWPPTCPPWCPPWPPWPPWPPCAEFVLTADGRPVPFPAVVDGEEFETDRIRIRAADPGVELGPEALTATEVLGTGLEELVFVDDPPSFP